MNIKKIIAFMFCLIFILNSCAKQKNQSADDNNSNEIWISDNFLVEYTNFEQEIWSYLHHNGVIGFAHDEEYAEKWIENNISITETPGSWYSLNKTYQLETRLGTEFEKIGDVEEQYKTTLIPKDMVKYVILQLFDIEENEIPFQSQDFKDYEYKENPDYFAIILVGGGSYFDAKILYDTLVYSPNTNIVTFDIKFYEEPKGEERFQFYLYTLRYTFQPFMYKEKIQQYKFISVERVF